MLSRDGVLFGGETCEAAMAGAAAGARVVCLRDAHEEQRPPTAVPWIGLQLGQVACRLRSNALSRRGFDERSCDERGWDGSHVR